MLPIIIFIFVISELLLFFIWVWKMSFFKDKQIEIALFKNELDNLLKSKSIDEKTEIKEHYYFTPKSYVEWFNLAGLINTFKRVSLSSETLSIIDKREVESNFGDRFQDVPYKRQKDKKEFWFDFVADTGDGFDETTTVFYALTRDQMIYDQKGEKIQMDRADLLVIGGDLVYPDATEENYINRFKGPIRFLFPSEKNAAKKIEHEFPSNNTLLVASPGNHDWYDGLNAFFRMMCQQKKIGNYQTIQERSYYAFQLTENVHLFGIDNQLMGDIDIPQLEYFSKYVKKIAKSNSKQYVILLVAEPNWYSYSWKDRGKRRQRMDSLEYIICELRKKSQEACKSTDFKNYQLIFKMVLCGDIHHYAHYENITNKNDDSAEIQHLVTSGGGGAFGHLTDFLDDVDIPDFKSRRSGFNHYELKTVYPKKEESSKKVFYNLLFPFINWKFTLIMMAISFVCTYIFTHNEGFFLRLLAQISIPTILYFIVSKVANPELSTREKWINQYLYITLFIASFLIQTYVMDYWKDTKIEDFPVVTFLAKAAPIHYILDLLHIDIQKGDRFFNFNELRFFQWITLGFLQSLLFGFYLFFSYYFFKVHITEASSSKVNKNNKNFLKFRITKDEITIYAIAIDKTYPWKSKFKKNSAIELQKEVYQSQENPQKFLRKTFGKKIKEDNFRVIDKIKIKL